MTPDNPYRRWEPPAARPWAMFMRWHDLLFAHWPIAPSLLRPLIPAGLELDTFDGSAWIGIVPFGMARVRPRLVPPVPFLSRFLELNVRTYVTAGSKAGVWFFSLDADSLLAVRGARWTYHLPYYDARMTLVRRDERIDYASARNHRGAPPATFDASYRPTGPARQAGKTDLEVFLTERYCLYAASPKGTLYRGDIDHAPWPLQPADGEFRRNTMTFQLGFTLPETRPLLHFARSLDVRAWRLVPV